MAGLLNFDSEKLNYLLKKYGLVGTWTNILATEIFEKPEFKYILKDDKFINYNVLDNNLIKNLSIGEIGVLYEYSLSFINVNNRKDKGQFFTPDDIAKLIASFSKQFETGIWLDPCCGIGNLSWHLINSQTDKESFAIHNLILSDTDELALFIARVLFTLSFQKKDTNFFNTIKNKFFIFDFLSVSGGVSNSLLYENNLYKIPSHDYVIVNPPYSQTIENINFETSKCTDTYAYFLENIIKTSKGFISITPQSFTNASKFYSLRKLLLDNFNGITIYNFDNVPDNIFHGIKFGSKNTNTANSIRASITVANKKSDSRQITSLLRWKTSERKKLLSNLDLFLSKVKLTPNYFPKVNNLFEKIFNELDKKNILGDLISNKETRFVLYIPSTPRYFIPALKKIVNRTSLKTIYFNNEKDMNLAYCLINSSFMYWWWRVRDGGMTLSLETIKSLPIIDFKIDKDIISELEKSELENKVYKINCGIAQENIKHPKVLLNKLNYMVIPKYYDLFIKTHENSEFEQLEIKL